MHALLYILDSAPVAVPINKIISFQITPNISIFLLVPLLCTFNQRLQLFLFLAVSKMWEWQNVLICRPHRGLEYMNEETKQLTNRYCAVDFWTANISYLHSKTYGHRVSWILIFFFLFGLMWNSNEIFEPMNSANFHGYLLFDWIRTNLQILNIAHFEQFNCNMPFYYSTSSKWILIFRVVCKLRSKTTWKYIVTNNKKKICVHTITNFVRVQSR